MNEVKMKKAVSVKQALEMFDDIVKIKSDLIFEYIKSGCQARAHLMCEYFFEKGLTPKKVWALSYGIENLKFKGSLFGKKFKWGFHVAPVIYIKTDDNIVKPMVIDPCLFDGPVLSREWGKAIGVKNFNYQIHIVPYGVAPKGQYGDYSPVKTTTEITPQKIDNLINCCFLRAKEEGAQPRKVHSSPLRETFNAKAQQYYVTINALKLKSIV